MEPTPAHPRRRRLGRHPRAAREVPRQEGAPRLDRRRRPGDAPASLKTSAIDLVVLDIMMPGEDGLSLCRMLRETTDMPVILLTAMVEETDRVVGLEIGADDYVTKPFSPRELLARIKAVLRRRRGLPRARRDAGTEPAPLRPLDARHAPARARRRGRRRGPAQHRRVPPAHRLPRTAADGAVARPAPRPHQRPLARALRALDRQPGEPAPEEDRDRPQEPGDHQDRVGRRLRARRRGRCGGGA